MNYKINGYNHIEAFHFFEDISAVPRGSFKEEKISDFLVQFAKDRGLEYYRDDSLNVIIKKPASCGCTAEPVILQGHIDMVCEKLEGCGHDFETEGLDLIVDGDTLRANDTTLGADDGVAVATMLYFLDNDTLSLPPLECVFTTGEEVGLLGATAIDCSQLRGKKMINIDSEDENIVTVSCAGGMRIAFDKEVKTETVCNAEALDIDIVGLKGGHSGMDIDKNRINAIRLMARILRYAQNYGWLISKFCGGNADNAIPREAHATIVASSEAKPLDGILKYIETVEAETGVFEPEIRINSTVQSGDYEVLTPADCSAILSAITLAPNGVLYKMTEPEDFVVTSSSLGIAKVENGKASIVFAPRSSVKTLQDENLSVFEILAENLGFEISVSGRYPGWAWKENSTIQELFKECSKDVFGTVCKLEAIHAGLECGLFSEAIPDLDVVSVGPTMTGVHTPEEKLSLSSFEKTIELIEQVLKKLAK